MRPEEQSSSRPCGSAICVVSNNIEMRFERQLTEMNCWRCCCACELFDSELPEALDRRL